jgi:hypothetical protein
VKDHVGGVRSSWNLELEALVSLFLTLLHSSTVTVHLPPSCVWLLEGCSVPAALREAACADAAGAAWTGGACDASLTQSACSAYMHILMTDYQPHPLLWLHHAVQ